MKPTKPIIPVNDTAIPEISAAITKNIVLHILISTPKTCASISPSEITSNLFENESIAMIEKINIKIPSIINSSDGIETLPIRNEKVWCSLYGSKSDWIRTITPDINEFIITPNSITFRESL